MKNNLSFFYRIINKIFFNTPMFTIVYPSSYPSIFSYKNLFSNFLFFIKKKKINTTINYFYKICFKFLMDLLKFFYSPLILIIYFSKYRFIQWIKGSNKIFTKVLLIIFKSLKTPFIRNLSTVLGKQIIGK